jgi:hypothetical protein
VFYEDLRGDLWIRNLEIAGDTIFCRFSNAASQWIRYDSTNSPFIYMKIAGEDPYTGNLYFQGTMPPSNDFAIYFLDRGPLSAVNPSEPRAPAHKTSFSGVLIGKNVIVNYSIPQFSRVNLSVYSPQGRLVQTLFSGYQKQGTYRQTFVFNHAPGVYLVKLSAPGAVQAVKIIAK